METGGGKINQNITVRNIVEVGTPLSICRIKYCEIVFFFYFFVFVTLIRSIDDDTGCYQIIC